MSEAVREEVRPYRESLSSSVSLLSHPPFTGICMIVALGIFIMEQSCSRLL